MWVFFFFSFRSRPKMVILINNALLILKLYSFRALMGGEAINIEGWGECGRKEQWEQSQRSRGQAGGNVRPYRIRGRLCSQGWFLRLLETRGRIVSFIFAGRESTNIGYFPSFTYIRMFKFISWLNCENSKQTHEQTHPSSFNERERSESLFYYLETYYLETFTFYIQSQNTKTPPICSLGHLMIHSLSFPRAVEPTTQETNLLGPHPIQCPKD